MNESEKILSIYNDKEVKSLFSLVERSTWSNLNQDEKNSIRLYTIWRCLKNFNRQKSSLKTYLFNSYRNNLRKESNYNKIPLFRPSFYNDNFKIKLELQDTLLLLPENDRNLIYKRFYENYTYQELANSAGISRQSASYRIKRSLNHLKTEYNSMDRTQKDKE